MTAARVKLIETRLVEVFSPIALQVRDQSHLHAGHEGAKSGGGHFDVRIVSEAFADKNPLQRHRLVYDALGALMKSEIHAVRITARTPEEL